MPIWEKIQVVDTETLSGLMIPLSYDNETLSSILFATVDDENSVTGVKNYDNNLLKSIVYDKSIDRKFREEMLYTFMYVDNKTFGNENFTNVPEDLFVGQKYDNKNGRIKIKNFQHSSNTHISDRMMYEEMCSYYWSCKNHELWDDCDHCQACYGEFCKNILVYVPDGTNTTFPSCGEGCGGGGGGTPGPIPPKDPCGLNTVFYRMVTGCNTSTGDDGDLIVEDPCTNLKNLLDPTKANIKPLITNGMYSFIDNIGNTESETGIYFKRSSTGNVTSEIAPPSGTNELPPKFDDNYYSMIHTHPTTTYPMFSYSDIYILYLLEVYAAPHNKKKTSLLLVCEDDSGVKQTYAILFEELGAMIEALWNKPENIGCSRKEIVDKVNEELKLAFDEESKKATPNYERVFLQFTFGTNIGLYKANADLTNWSKLTIDENSDSATVNPINCN